MKKINKTKGEFFEQIKWRRFQPDEGNKESTNYQHQE